MTLLAHETEFWMRLYVSWICFEEQLYRSHEDMTEAYSSNFWPVIQVKE